MKRFNHEERQAVLDEASGVGPRLIHDLSMTDKNLLRRRQNSKKMQSSSSSKNTNRTGVQTLLSQFNLFGGSVEQIDHRVMKHLNQTEAYGTLDSSKNGPVR